MTGARIVVVLAMAACAGGCATAIRGASQVVLLTSSPPGARCTLMLDDAETGTVASTPGRATIARSARDLVVICRKDGHHDGRTLLIAGERESMFREAMTRGADSAPSPQEDGVKGATDAAAVAVVEGTAAVGVAVAVPALIGAGLGGSTAAASVAIALAPLGLLGPFAMAVDASKGAYSAYPESHAVMLLPREFPRIEDRDAAIQRFLAGLERDDEALRRRFDETCGLTCRRTKPTLEAFLAARRADLQRQLDAATLTPR